MTELQLKKMFPNAARSFIERNAEDHKACCVTQSPKPEQAVRHEPVAKEERKDSHPGIVQVRVVSFRSRLLDPDNLCPKYFIDCLRYAKLIKDDNQSEIELSVKQVKVKKDQERTEIELEYL